jgi:PAS domain S-box-containing protein
MLIVTTSVALVTIPAAGIIYYFAKQDMMATKATNLVGETKSLVVNLTQNLAQAESSLVSLTRLLGKALSAPPESNEDAAFASMVRHDADGAWRSRREGFDGTIEAGVFLPADAPLDSAQKRLHIRSKRILDVFGGSITTPFTNVWLLTHGKTEVIQDHGVPDFALQIAADTDYTQTDWVTLGSPAVNPERGLRWTPPLFDPVPKSWMVSAIMPLDVQGRWLGTVGHDIYLENVFPKLFKPSQRYTGEVNLLLDAQGNFILAGPWQQELEAKPENFKPDLSHETGLAKLLAAKLDGEPHAFSEEVSLQGRQYLAVGAIMAPMGWHYFRLIPTDEVLAPMRRLVIELASMVLVMGLLIGLLIEVAVDRNIVQRLRNLAQVVHRYGKGELTARSKLSGNDEIALTSREFDAMADQLEATLEAIPDLFLELDLDGRYYAVHANKPDQLVVPRATLIGQTIYEALPAEAAKVCATALQEANVQGRSYGQQFQLALPSGLLWFELSVAKKYGSADIVPHFIVLSRDITERKQIEQSLKLENEKNIALLRNASDGISIMDYDGRVVEASDSFCSMLGYSRHEVIGMHVSQWDAGFHDVAEQMLVVRKQFESTKRAQFKTRHRRKDGSIYDAEVSGMALMLEGRPVLFNTTRDITESLRAEAHQRVAATAFESHEGMMITDADTLILQVNQAFTTITGYSAEEAIGKKPSFLRSGRHDAEFYSKMWASINATGSWKGLVWNKRKNGENYPEHLTVTAVRDQDGVITNYVGSLIDSTDRQQAMDKLRATAVELEYANAQIKEERERLAERVEERTAQLRDANQAKDSFLATMSHEIRTPLGGLLGMMELLSISKLSDEQKNLLAVAQTSGKNLLRIVNDILDWSKIEAGKLELALREASIVEMLAGVVGTYSQLAAEKNITISLETDLQLSERHLFDPLRLSQILNNFTSNAVKFTTQGNIVISARRIKQHANYETVRFSVQDNGVGIDLEHQKRLFQHYEQATADTARMYGGTGLGLAICKRLAELMDGTLSVESAPGEGSTFSFTYSMPVVRGVIVDSDALVQEPRLSKTVVTAGEEVLAFANRNLSILIVDDHPINRMLLKQQLEMLGLRVEAAADGVIAYAMWQSSHFDLIISDCHMPQMSGYELSSSIRELELQAGVKRIPIIAWTANVLAEEAERCAAAGMDDILTKPTELAVLRETLLKWLGD